MLSKFLLFFILTILFLKNCSGEDPVVFTANGPYRGSIRSGFISFEGIPYAEPPVGDLRFATPVPYTSYHKEIRDATKPGSDCIQKHGATNPVKGSEDCLFVNIYTPNATENVKLPVIVHIHGGGFIYGAGAEYGPDHLIQRNVVFVTLNYRLGIMGFLSSDSLFGNMGLKDQSMALRWIKKNIRVFGGDPDNVTLVGWSAGSVSVQFHYLSPMSKGLFSRGIAHSGCFLNPWVWQKSPEWKFNQISSRFGCALDDYPYTKTLECLKKIPAQEIVEISTDTMFQPFEGHPFNPFGVILEKNPDNKEPFLPEDLLVLFAQGKVQKLPLIISGVRDEGYYPGAEFLAKPEIFPIVNAQFDEILPRILHLPVSDEDKNAVLNATKAIRKYYMGDEPVSEATFDHFVKILTDYLYLTGFLITIDQFSSVMPTYVYGFDYKTTYGFGDAIAHRNSTKGVAHGEDIVLIYETDIRRDKPFTADEKVVMGHLLDIYESFAYSGVPGIQGGGKMKSTMSGTKSLTFTHIRGPNDFYTITTGYIDEFVNKPFWDTIHDILYPTMLKTPSTGMDIYLISIKIGAVIVAIIMCYQICHFVKKLCARRDYKSICKSEKEKLHLLMYD